MEGRLVYHDNAICTWYVAVTCRACLSYVDPKRYYVCGSLCDIPSIQKQPLHGVHASFLRVIKHTRSSTADLTNDFFVLELVIT